MPDRPVTDSSPAQNQLLEGVPEVLTFSPASLLSGDNVLAVEVHQVHSASSDDVFGMTLDAFISGPSTNSGQLQIVLSGNNVIVSWSGPGTLQSTPSLSPPSTWTDINATSPYTVPALGTQKFYRLRIAP